MCNEMCYTGSEADSWEKWSSRPSASSKSSVSTAPTMTMLLRDCTTGRTLGMGVSVCMSSFASP